MTATRDTRPMQGRARPDQAADANPDPLIGRWVGNFQITSQLGAGGMGAVYRAKHRRLDEWRAIKVLLPEMAQHREMAARFAAEALAASAAKHENIIRVFDEGTLEGPHGPLQYIVMELLDGIPLSARPMPIADVGEIASIMVPVAQGLQAAHRIGIVHRDLKPDNIFLANDHGRQVPKVLDFGIAKMRGTGVKTRSHAVFGTVSYMAPEQARSAGSTDHRSDIYAMAVITYRLVTGRLPYEGSLYEIAAKQHEGPPPDPRVFRSDIPAGWSALLLACLSMNPADRSPSALAFAEELLAGLPGGDELAERLAFVPTGERRRAGPHTQTQSVGAAHQLGLAAAALGPAEPTTLGSAAAQSVAPAGAGRRRPWRLGVAAAVLAAAAALGVTALVARGSHSDDATPAVAKQPPGGGAPRVVRAAPQPASTPAAAGVSVVGPPAAVDAAPAAPAPARLVIAVTPVGAHVSVDGVDVGAAPVTLERAAGTEVAVRARKRGYATTVRTVTVGAAPRLELALKRARSGKRTHHHRATESPEHWGRPGGSLEDLVKP